MRIYFRYALTAAIMIASHASWARTYDLRLDGNTQGGEAAGWALATGDINGDGFADLAVSSPVVPGNYSGLVRLILGAEARIRPRTSLASAATTNIKGPEEGGQAGWALAFGNFDSDQYADLAIGQPFGFCYGNLECGAVHVVYGSKDLPKEVQLGDTPTGHVVRYMGAPGDRVGMTLAACDVDGDGVDDLIVGAPQASNYTIGLAGSIYVLYGHVVHPAWGSTIRLDELSPDLGFRIDGVNNYQGAGAAITCLRSAKGRDVLAIGSRLQGIGAGPTAVWLVHDLAQPVVGNLLLVPSANVLEIDQDNLSIEEALGVNLAAVDVNGDGCDDLAIAEPWVGDYIAGRVYVLYGCTSIYAADTLVESQITGKIGFHVTGQPGDYLGDPSVAGGNVDGDQYGDLIIGSIYSTSTDGLCKPSFGDGVAYVLHGSKTEKDDVQAATLDCITTKRPEGGWSTWALALGDFDGNGFDDIASGAIYGGPLGFGAVYYCYSGPNKVINNAAAYACNAVPNIHKPTH